MSILNKIKKGVKNSGSNKGKLVYLKADSKTRIRFLQEIEDGLEVVRHDNFQEGIDVICQTHVGKKCKYCGDKDLRTRDSFVWSVWDYEAKEVKLFIGFANNFNPLPALIGMYEAYGTICDRDYVINREGSGTNTRYSVVPMDKVKFRNKKAKPFSEKKALDILDKAFPPDNADSDDEDWDEDGEENEYEDMSPKELYMECIERGINAKKKQKKKYYIDLLEEDDEEDSDEEDEWEDDDEEDDEDDW